MGYGLWIRRAVDPKDSGPKGVRDGSGSPTDPELCIFVHQWVPISPFGTFRLGFCAEFHVDPAMRVPPSTSFIFVTVLVLMLLSLIGFTVRFSPSSDPEQQDWALQDLGDAGDPRGLHGARMLYG